MISEERLAWIRKMDREFYPITGHEERIDDALHDLLVAYDEQKERIAALETALKQTAKLRELLTTARGQLAERSMRCVCGEQDCELCKEYDDLSTAIDAALKTS